MLPVEFLKKPDGVVKTATNKSSQHPKVKEVIANDDKDKGTAADADNDDTPKHMSAVLDTSVTFKQLGICEELVSACTAMGYKFPTKIQKEAVPFALQGRDIIGLAQTGSGKTAAFALPIVQDLLKQHTESRSNAAGVFGLAIAPTRELAIQIAKQFEALGAGISLRVAVLVGGMETMQQCIALAKKPHIIVGTPGRIVYHLENTRGFTLRSVKYLVLDEADRLLNLDFEQELNTILKILPKERHTYLFSATMTTKVQKLQRASLNNPVKVEVSTKYATVDTLVQQYMFVPAKYKDCYLVYALTELAGNSVIIFTATCITAQKTTAMLRNLGFAAVPLHGNMSQPKRLAALNKFQAGERKILVATDVASRGLDIPLVDIVINYDTPTHSKDYIHRVGRTARAGASGRGISIVTQYDVELFQRIEEMIGVRMELYKTEEDQVLTLLERVTEAQRIATMELREAGAIKKEKSKNDVDDDDRDTGNELKIKKRPAGGKDSHHNNKGSKRNGHGSARGAKKFKRK